MNKIYKIIICFICILTLIACDKSKFVITIDVSHISDVLYFYADERIVPIKDYIYVSMNGQIEDTQVILLEEGKTEEDALYDYLTHGLSSKIEVEKGKTYKIGILNKEEYRNLSENFVYEIVVDGVEVFIED